MPKASTADKSSWLERPLFSTVKLNWETGLFAVILILAIFTRFYDLGERVMSHDETTHVYFSWLLYQGQGYSHHPLSHGPLQFHLLALSYFLFGDNDFSARAPQALFGVAAIAFLWAFRRYLGRIGALVAAFLFLISPYMMYYARYARNESFVMLLGMVMLWAVLRYLDREEPKYLYVFTAAIALHFTAKETSFIYTAQALLFLGLLFLWRITNRRWGNQGLRKAFFVALFLSAALVVIALGTQLALSQPSQAVITGTEVLEPVVAGETEAAATPSNILPITLILAGSAIGVLLGSLFFLIRGYGWDRLRKERSFNLMLLLFTLVLPHLAAFPVYWLGRDPMNYADTNNLVFIVLIVAALAAVSIAIGLSWSRRIWLANFAIFYVIFVPLYTTIFTNGTGFFSGLVGSLGYWLEQQGVERGSQPSYFYWGVQIPIYEFVAAAGALLAAWIGFRIWRADKRKKGSDDTEKRNLRPAESRRLALWLLAFWAATSVAAYTIAGEKMPWLTSHIALPLVLLAGWALGWVIRRVDWDNALKPRGILIAALIVVFLLAVLGALGALLGTRPPFQGQETVNLAATYRFMFLVILTVVSGYTIYSLVAKEKWNDQQVSLTLILVVFSSLAFVGARAALRASFISYDSATEYLVYAHMARGPGEIMDQIEEISKLTTDGLDLQVAYDNETSYPFWWYLRNYPNQRYYADQPNRDLRQAPVIVVGDANYGKIEPVVGQAYYMFEFVRIWWPNQDYFEFSPDAVRGQFAAETEVPDEEMGIFDYLRLLSQRLYGYLGNAQLREGIWQIWLNRNFRPYLEAKGQDPSPSRWNPARSMRMYVRKDVAAMIWDYGVPPAEEAIVADPYEGKGIELSASLQVGDTGSALGQFNAPRGLAFAPDGTIYVADASNHRIQHLDADGNVIESWGQFGDASTDQAGGGSFNEPWGVAVSPDGRYVYVADTWNHRVQKFTADGRFLDMWGTFGQDETEFAMWGPRDLVVDNNGNVLVVDTGNKRIKIFDANGNFVSQYGEFGFDPGQFDEPVGITLDRESNRLYVADTWNQRVQVFQYSADIFEPVQQWNIAGWFGQSLFNKPYLSIGPNGRVFISDPEGGRVLVYESDGTFVHFFGGYDQTSVNIGVAQGVAANAGGILWLSDSQNNKLLKFEID